MELLPDAERLRRGLLLLVATVFLVFEALFPQPLIERVADRVVAPLAALVAPLAGWALGRWELPDAAAPPEPSGPGLVEAEERLGHPPAVAGLRWVAVPVLRREGARWTLGAGRAFGLAEGQAVVFGRSWLGRIHGVEEQRSTLVLWTAPGAGTGARLGNGESLARSFCEGRGVDAEGLLRFLEPGRLPEDGETVFWRRRAEDPPSLEALALELGTLHRRGDERRRNAYWAVASSRPAGAEGRVFVALGAVPERPLREPERRSLPARALLPVDAVCGPRLAAITLREAVPAAAVGGPGGLCGPIQSLRGRIAWLLRRPPEAWGVDAVAVLPDGGMSTLAGLGPDSGAWLYTRGGPRLPRGLPIGPLGGGPLPLGGGLEAYWR